MGEGIALYYLHSGGIGRYKKDYDKRFSFGIVFFRVKRILVCGQIRLYIITSVKWSGFHHP